MVKDLSRVFLLVKDLARSIQFYREFFERAPASEDARHARFDLGQVSLTIHEDLTQEETAYWRVGPVPEQRGWGVYLTLATDDLDANYKKLGRLGAEIVSRPQVTPWRTRMLIARDPDGYLLEICQRDN